MIIYVPISYILQVYMLKILSLFQKPNDYIIICLFRFWVGIYIILHGVLSVKYFNETLKRVKLLIIHMTHMNHITNCFPPSYIHFNDHVSKSYIELRYGFIVCIIKILCYVTDRSQILDNLLIYIGTHLNWGTRLPNSFNIQYIIYNKPNLNFQT